MEARFPGSGHIQVNVNAGIPGSVVMERLSDNEDTGEWLFKLVLN